MSVDLMEEIQKLFDNFVIDRAKKPKYLIIDSIRYLKLITFLKDYHYISSLEDFGDIETVLGLTPVCVGNEPNLKVVDVAYHEALRTAK